MSIETQMQNGGETPIVFISYSHDTPAHKKWVGALASKLVDNGVQVMLDQWDLTLGDDVVKFMERCVSEAHCVLMICTGPYVRKADAGVGGVGYETMIVTGELIQHLGSAKFIPVIRQEVGEQKLPACVSTRYFSNLSEGANFEEEFENLLRRIHGVPKFKKPALGANPFTPELADLGKTDLGPKMSIPESHEQPEELYESACGAIRQGDQLLWRKLVKTSRQTSWQRLLEWRSKGDEAAADSTEDAFMMANAALEAFAPFFITALAGVESANERFKRQTGIIDELLAPSNWKWSGHSGIADAPDTLIFIFQALHGAICMETGQYDLAAQLVQTEFRALHSTKREPLLYVNRWMGWPSSISENCTDAWEFLASLSETHPWIRQIFGRKEEYLTALSSYYALLNIIELRDLILAGEADGLDRKQLHLSIPLCAFSIHSDLSSRALRLLTRDKNGLKSIWESAGVPSSTLAIHWPSWITGCKQWLWGVYRNRTRYFDLYHESLLKELGHPDSKSKIGAMVG